MLIFPARIQTETARLRTTAESVDGVEAFLVWPAVVVGDGLAEVETIAQRQAADVRMIINLS